MKKTLIKIIGYFLLSVFVLMIVWVCDDFMQARRFPIKRFVCEQRGNQIAVALDKFKNDKGSYPEKLGELVPEYLTEVEKPVLWNKEWEYHQGRGGETFSLLVGKGKHNYPSLFYSPNGWYLDN